MSGHCCLYYNGYGDPNRCLNTTRGDPYPCEARPNLPLHEYHQDWRCYGNDAVTKDSCSNTDVARETCCIFVLPCAKENVGRKCLEKLSWILASVVNAVYR
jgi:hypothetical protein